MVSSVLKSGVARPCGVKMGKIVGPGVTKDEVRVFTTAEEQETADKIQKNAKSFLQVTTLVMERVTQSVD